MTSCVPEEAYKRDRYTKKGRSPDKEPRPGWCEARGGAEGDATGPRVVMCGQTYQSRPGLLLTAAKVLVNRG